MVRKNFKDSVDWIFSIVLVSFLVATAAANKEGYYGQYLGKLSQLHHGVSGDVFAVDARTLHLRNFNYDGEGPAAYFYAGNSKAPGVNGFRLRDERGTTNVLPRYRNKHITITLPEGKTLHNIRWFSVWCDEFSVNFGDVKIPKNLDFPKPQKINGLSGVHGVSSEPIVIVDAQTLLIPSFSYDGEAPDAKFWVGRGFKPSPQGIRVPDENGKEVPLRRYDRKTIVLTLPGDLTIFDIGHFGVWCEAFTVDFGHVQIPRGLNVPPSLKMLGVSPQSKLNCEVLWDDFAYEVRWAVAGDSIVLQLVARLENNEYMSFGLSGDKSRSRMVGGDVVVAWVDKETLKGYAQDYYLDAKSQCSGGRGSCPDENIIPGTDSVRLLNAALVNGYSIVTFQRSLKAQDELDRPVYTNGSQAVIWAIGPLNSRKEVSYHSLANKRDIFIDFGRSPKWNCPTPESSSEQTEQEPVEVKQAPPQDARSQESVRGDVRPKTQIPTPAPAPKTKAWDIPPIKCYEPEDGVFYAQMGPTGGKRGYPAITGHVGWGISWYINGLLIPEINVVRGRTYTFIVEGGLDPEIPARYHPFYITDDPVGGYQYKTPQERANIQIFAGAVQNKRGEVRPTGVGRLCNWNPDPNQPPADEFSSFGAYQRTLRLECDPGNPGIIQWTVEKDTPDTVYYQCYTHRYLGWKINVHDTCEEEAASEPRPTIVKAPENFQVDSEGSESISYETRVKPDEEFLKEYLARNQSSFRVNDLVQPSFKYRPEFYDKNTKEILLSQVSGLVNNPFDRNQVKENIKLGGAEGLTHQLRAQLDASTRQRVPDVQTVPILPAESASKRPSYSVREEVLEGDNLQGLPVAQNFQIVPVAVTAVPIQSLNAFDKFQNQIAKESIKHEIAPVQTVIIPEQIKKDKYTEQLVQNQFLRGQSEEKVKRPSVKIQYAKPVNRPLKIQGLAVPPNRMRKPPTMHTLALQQRPFIPGPFRGHFPPGKHSKRTPTPGHLKVLHAKPPHRLQAELEESVKKQEGLKKFQHHKKPTFVPETRPADLFSSPLTIQQTVAKAPFAHNTGFDPQSVQVEGGFKPILNAAAAASRSGTSLIDRMDEDTEDADSEIGTIDLRTDSSAVQEKTDEKNHKDNSGNLFTNLKPQTFEPIFIPSIPDDSLKKYKDEKVQAQLKHRNDPFQYQKSASQEDAAKLRENFPLNHRYPEEESRVNNGTLNRKDRAGNILEVMEMSGEDNRKDTDETAMADERKDYYLPPRADRVLAYDGKLVKAGPAPKLPESSPASDVSKLPQFVPFKGVLPPLTQTVNAKNLPQLRTSKLARHDILPPAEASSGHRFDSSETSFPGDAAARVKRTNQQERSKRSPDHVPGHVGPDPHDHHDHHDHHHDHSLHSGSSSTSSNLFFVAFVAISLQVAIRYML